MVKSWLGRAPVVALVFGAVAFPARSGVPTLDGAGEPPLHLQAPARSALTDRVIVQPLQALDRATLRQALSAFNLLAPADLPRLTAVRQMHDGAWVLRLSRAVEPSTVEAWRAPLTSVLGDLSRLEPDLRLRALATPNDPLYSQQWSLSDATAGIRLAPAHDTALGRGVVVAVIDNGVRRHADLADNLTAGFDFVSDAATANDGGGRDADPADPGDGHPAGFCTGDPAPRSSVWHGTHVAGIAAALTGNGQGMAGVAPLAQILPVRVLGRCGGYLSDVADGLVWAAGGQVPGVPANPTPARVMNLSLGGSGACPASMQTAVNLAVKAGALVVVAAGNGNASATGSVPANCSGVLAVAATGLSGGKASYSNTGANVALAAPGGDGDAGILSAYNSGSQGPAADTFAALSGTSMAAPHVAGVAALVLSAYPSATAAQVRQVLVSTARPFPASCTGCGAGIVDAAAAVAQAVREAKAGAPTPPAEPAPPPPVVTLMAEVEPNNTVSSPQSLPRGPLRLSGAIDQGDVDHFAVPLPAGASVTAMLTPAAGLNFDLQAFDPSGRLLASSAQGTGASDTVVVRNSSGASTVVVLRVLRGGFLVLASPNGRYTLDVNP